MITAAEIRPLSYAAGWPPRRSLLERIGLWIPVVGWVISGELENRRLNPGYDAICDQLALRADVPAPVWGNAQRADIAKRIIKCITSEIDWLHPRFAPNDPFEILIEWQTGDCCAIPALKSVAREFGLTMDDDATDRFVKMTFGEVVDFIAASSNRITK